MINNRLMPLEITNVSLCLKVGDTLTDASIEVIPILFWFTDMRPGLFIVLGDGRLIVLFIEMVGGGTSAMLAGSVGETVVVTIGLDDGALVSHAGDVQASLWSGSVFDSDMWVVERVGVMISVWIEELDCTVIGLAPNIDMVADGDINVWASVTAVSKFVTSRLSLEGLLLF